nr:MAG TPA: tail connector protein [Caudoviricetes sp.]
MEIVKDNIIEYLKIINKSDIEEELRDFIVESTIDRIKLYLNNDKLPKILERPIAQIISTNIDKAIRQNEISKDGDVDRAITSVKDNNQSVNYSNELTRYFSSLADEELFSGFTSLLNRYRRIKVVYSETIQKNN